MRMARSTGEYAPSLRWKAKRLGRGKRWLREKTRAGTAMLLSCMHHKRMAKIDGPRLSGRQYLKARGGFSKTVCG